MGRKSSSFLDDLFEIAAKLPPWAGLILAALSYVICRYLSLIDVAPPTGMEDMARLVWGSAIRVFSIAGQFLLPLAFGLGAIASFVRRQRGKRLVRNVRLHSNGLDKVSWSEFELLVSTLLRNEGFAVTDNFNFGPDGGVDQVLRKNGKKYLVQCKHWKAQKVGVSVVREMFGLMVAEGAEEVWIVTSGSFTQDAIKFADGKSIKLIDGTELEHLARTDVRSTQSEIPLEPKISRQACPRCGASMIKRRAKRGANAGTEFFGCSRFPSCRGVQEIQ